MYITEINTLFIIYTSSMYKNYDNGGLYKFAFPPKGYSVRLLQIHYIRSTTGHCSFLIPAQAAIALEPIFIKTVSLLQCNKTI